MKQAQKCKTHEFTNNSFNKLSLFLQMAKPFTIYEEFKIYVSFLQISGRLF